MKNQSGRSESSGKQWKERCHSWQYPVFALLVLASFGIVFISTHWYFARVFFTFWSRRCFFHRKVHEYCSSIFCRNLIWWFWERARTLERKMMMMETISVCNYGYFRITISSPFMNEGTKKKLTLKTCIVCDAIVCVVQRFVIINRKTKRNEWSDSHFDALRRALLNESCSPAVEESG